MNTQRCETANSILGEHFSQERYGTIMNMSSIRIIILTSILLLAGCQQVDQPSSDTLTIRLIHDKVRNTIDTNSRNVGDLLSRWTDGVYRSTKHRVINSSGRERLSLVLAYDPDPDTVIDARNIFGPEHKAAEEPITCGDYLIWRFEKAFPYREAKQ